jgi:hypothetical protein
MQQSIAVRTALWVGKLKGSRPEREVAGALAAIARGHPECEGALESHFRGFCSSAADADSIWAEAVESVPPDTHVDDAVQALRAMYWTDNPDDCLLETKGYEQVKHKIEHEWGYWKCGMPVGYARVNASTGEINILCQSKMRDCLLDVHYAQPAVGPDGRNTAELVPIGQRWLSDENKRRYERIVVDPTMKHAANEYNMWTGFAAEKLPPVPDELVPALVKPLLDHILHVLAAGKEEDSNYIVDWMAFLVQKPERKTQTLLLFYGQQGTGKGLIWDFLREYVLGHHACTQTANAKNDLFDRFSNGFLHKRLVQLDEVCAPPSPSFFCALC